MATKQQVKQPADEGNQERAQLSATLGKHVLLGLGQPGDLFRMQVRPLWDGHFRVNVLVAPGRLRVQAVRLHRSDLDAGRLQTCHPAGAAGVVVVSDPTPTRGPSR